MKFVLLFTLLIFSVRAQSSQIKAEYKKISKKIHTIYKDFHQHPELSGKEFRTAQKMAQYLKDLGYQVTENFGGTGVVGVLKNGKGPTVWLRADMDGLPILEETRVKYASKNKGVMHGCGHDTHISAMVGYAEILKNMKNQWKGTLVLIVQPAEETGQGAAAMIKKGLYKKFPKPDYVVGFHVGGGVPAGKIQFTKGYALAAADSFKLVINGIGGHGASPHRTVDPITLSAKIMMSLQTIVSRNREPQEPVVLSFGKISGGTKSNIIPNQVVIEGTLRTYDIKVRKKVIQRMRDIIRLTAKAEGAPAPKLTFSEGTPSTYNDLNLADTLLPVLGESLKSGKVDLVKGIMGAEDFSRYGQNKKYPTFFYFVGGAPKNKKNYGSNHSSKFAPEYKTVLKIGVETMTRSTLHLMNK